MIKGALILLGQVESGFYVNPLNGREKERRRRREKMIKLIN